MRVDGELLRQVVVFEKLLEFCPPVIIVQKGRVSVPSLYQVLGYSFKLCGSRCFGMVTGSRSSPCLLRNSTST